MFPPAWLKSELLCPLKIPPVAAFFKKDWANSFPEALANGLPNKEGALVLLKGELFVWIFGFANKLGEGWLPWLAVNRLAGGLLVWIFVNKLEWGWLDRELDPKNGGLMGIPIWAGGLLELSNLLGYPVENTGFALFPKNGRT